MVPPAADAAGPAQTPAVWSAVVVSGADNGEPGPDDITTPMNAIHDAPGQATAQDVPADGRREPEAGRDTKAASEPGRPRTRGPFEPANDLAPPVNESLAEPFYRGKLPPPPDAPGQLKPVPSWTAKDEQAGSAAVPESGKPMSQAARASMWSPATGTMEQIKDLYLTAEAIGDDALDKHFQLVSDRQRQLIREYFDDPARKGTDAGRG